MDGVAGQQIRAQQQQANGGLVDTLARQSIGVFSNAAFDVRVVNTQLRVLNRVFDLDFGAVHLPGALGITIHQSQHHVGDVQL